MAYGSEVHSSDISFQAVLEHTPSAVRLSINVSMFKADNTIPLEATQNAVFQAFLNKLAEIPNTTIVSAVKRGGYSTTVTAG